jgi:uncharacterized repeat protein (TIGR01451 family)
MMDIEGGRVGLPRVARTSAGLGISLAVLMTLGAHLAVGQGVQQFQVVTLPPCQSAGQVVEVDVSTGQNVIAGQQDPLWELVAVPPNQTGAFPSYATIPYSSWVSATPPAGWIHRVQNPTPQADSAGNYTYRLQFSLNPAFYSAVQIVGSYSADNSATVQLNGVTQTFCPGIVCFQGLHSFSINSGFVNGVNNLDIIVNNSSGPSPTGLLVEAKLQATCLAGGGCVQPPSGMVAWYPLDEHIGATAVNDIAPPPSSLFNNVGTPHPGPVGPLGPNSGPASVVGMVGGGALYFYGPYVEVAPQSELDFGTGDFSIDGWVSAVECIPQVFSPIVDKYDTNANTGFSFYLSQNPASTAFLDLQVNASTFTSTGSLVSNASPILNTGPWYHVAVTVNRATGFGVFYINGSASGTFTPPPGTVTNTVPMWIGKLHSQGNRCEIAVDELEIFNRALTQTEIQGIYSAGSAGKCRPAPDAPSDLGDAPDSTNHAGIPMLAYLSPPVTAHYPTVHDPALPGWRGPKHLNAKGAVWLGTNVSFESEADMGADQDGGNNLNPSSGAADQDNDDDGVNPNSVLLPGCGSTQFTFGVTAAPTAPAGNYYVNAWFDFNRDGDWDDTFRCAMGPAIDARGQEWAVQNMLVSVPGSVVPGGSATLTTPPFVSYNPVSGPMWMRITISEQPVIAGDNGGPFTLPADLGRGGSVGTTYPNGYSFGETEDYLLEPKKVELCGVKWNDLNGDGVQQQGEPGLPNWEIDVTDSGGNPVAFVITGTNGEYCAVVPAPASSGPSVTYTISEVQQSGWTQTSPGGQGTFAVTLPPVPGTNFDFGNTRKVQDACDLAIDKRVDPSPVGSGQQSTFTITVTNVGNVSCPGITTVTDSLPAGLQVVSVAQGGSLWDCSVTGANPPAMLACTWDASVQPVPPGPLPAITLTTKVTAPAGSIITNCATLGNPNDSISANNRSCAALTVSRPVHRRVQRP